MTHNYTDPPESNFEVSLPFSNAITWDASSSYLSQHDFTIARTYEMGLRAVWAMDSLSGSTVLDSAGNGNTGNLQSGSLASGKFGDALSLSGNGGLDSQAVKSTDPSIGISAGAWIFPYSLPNRSDPTYARDYQVFERAYFDFALSFDSWGAPDLMCTAKNENNTYYHARTPVSNGFLGSWHHVACVLEPITKELRLFVDGQRRATTTANISSFPNTWAPNFTVGNRTAANRGNRFDGLIDDFAVWGRSLLDSEISSLVTENNPLTPRSESRIQSGRVDPGESFSDVQLTWDATPGEHAVYYSTDAGQSWCKILNGESASKYAARCSLPARSLMYRYIFFSDSLIDSMTMNFTTGVSPVTEQETAVGLNLTAPTDWLSDLVFKDAMKTARAWMAVDETKRYWTAESASQIPLRADGYPESLPYTPAGAPRPLWVHTIVIDQSSARPTGTYSLRFEGEGRVNYRHPGSPSVTYTFTEAGSYPVEYNTTSAAALITIESSNPANPVRNIRLIYPEFANQTNEQLDQQPFTPQFLNSVRGARVLRFMDWMRTNNQLAYEWSARNTPQSMSQAMKSGVAMEHIVQLANEIDADVWVCMPHLGTDTLFQNYAEFLRDNLEPGRKVYVEFSNELWNTVFDQGDYAAARPEGREQFVAATSFRIFKIFQDALGPSRVVNVMPGHVASATYNQALLAFQSNPTVNPHAMAVDALAIAPYVGGEIPNAVAQADLEVGLSTEGLLDRLQYYLDTQYVDFLDQNVAIANQHTIRLIAYEGGHHLAPPVSEENNDTLVDIIIEANYHPRMEQIYRDMLSIWAEKVHDVFMAFATTARYEKHNTWGFRSRWDEPIGDAPKYRAIRRAMDIHTIAAGLGSGSCGNNIAEVGEECDGSDFRDDYMPKGGNLAVDYSRNFSGGTVSCNPDCTISTASATPIAGCTLQRVVWDDDDWRDRKPVNQTIKFFVKGLNCLNQLADVRIYEEAGATDRLVDTVRVRFEDMNRAVGRWFTTLTGAQPDPARFYLTATLVSDPAKTISAPTGLLRICPTNPCS